MAQVAPTPWEQQHPPTPLFGVDGWRGEGGHVGWGLQLVPGHLQDLQAPQGTESTVLDAADLVLVQLPMGESSRSVAGTAQGHRLAPRTACCPSDPKLLRASPCPALLGHSQVLEVGGPAESFPGDGLDEVLAQVPAGERGGKENERCLHDTMLRGIIVSPGGVVASRDAQGALHNQNLAPRDLQPLWPRRGDPGSIQGGCMWLGFPGTGVPWLQ